MFQVAERWTSATRNFLPSTTATAHTPKLPPPGAPPAMSTPMTSQVPRVDRFIAGDIVPAPLALDRRAMRGHNARHAKRSSPFAKHAPRGDLRGDAAGHHRLRPLVRRARHP